MDGSHGSNGPGARAPATVPSSHAGASAFRTPTASSSAKRSSASSWDRSSVPDPFVSSFSIASSRRAALVGTPSPVFRWFTILAKLSPYAQGAPHLDQSLDPSYCLLNDGMIGKDDENNPRFPARGRTTGARRGAMVHLEGFARKNWANAKDRHARRASCTSITMESAGAICSNLEASQQRASWAPGHWRHARRKGRAPQARPARQARPTRPPRLPGTCAPACPAS